jgi:hypothetical protein
MADFKTTEELAEYQAEREVAEALRFFFMSPEERYDAIEKNWSRIQADGTALFSRYAPKTAACRHYQSFEEKNRFDAQREMQIALKIREDRLHCERTASTQPN